jgi:RHS repeat-associated protein
VWSAGDPGVTDHEVTTHLGYDSYGRVICSENQLGTDATCTPGDEYTTSTTYSSAYGTGLATTQVVVSTPLTCSSVTTCSVTSATTTTLAAAWGTPVTTTDANGETTTYAYDPLGEVTGVWLPGEPTGSAASYAYAYHLSATAPSYIATTTLTGPANVPVTSYQIYDSLLRLRQTQAPAPALDENPAEVTDTFYDSRGNTVIQNGPYPVDSAASGTLLVPDQTESAVPDETASTYDGAGRLVESDLDSYGTLQSKTTWTYPGSDEVTEVPPAGGTVTSTYTDGLGRATQIRQYQSQTAASGPYTATGYAYSYIAGGSTSTVTDAAGNTWTTTSDLLGRTVSAAGPDTGTTTSTYNDLGQLTSSTDTAGHTISFRYDAGGRKIASYAAPVTGQSAANELAAWTYDTPAIGQLSTATSYYGGTSGSAYTETINSYDPAYHPTSTTWSIPSNSTTGATAGSYTFGSTYNADGTPSTLTYPAAGTALGSEQVSYGYNSLGDPYSLYGASSDYVIGTYYDSDGQPTETDLGTSTSGTWSRLVATYDPATLRLATTQVEHETTSGWTYDDNTTYTDDPSGNITAAADSVTGDNQCYTYDYLDRLTAAWSQASTSCPAQAPGASGLGGPAPYQQTLTYDNNGTANGSTNGTTSNITSSTLITGTGASSTTSTASYTYPPPGSPQPNAPTSATVTTGSTTITTASTWTTPGQLTSTTPSAGSATTYNWNGTGAPPDQLASATTGSSTTSYVYDADGDLLLANDNGTTTLYLPGQDIIATGSTLTATRYYTFNGQTVAARTSPTALTWLFPGPTGTDTTAIDATTEAVTHRYYTPYGTPRGTPPASWPGTRGFDGGTTDTTTGLTNLGARQYNPANATFISPDPILNPQDPQDLNPYNYAANNPITDSDPSGLCPIGPTGTCYNPGPGQPQPPTGAAGNPSNPSAGIPGNCPATSPGCPGYTPPGSTALPQTARAAYESYYTDAYFSGNSPLTPYAAGSAAYDLSVLAEFCGSNQSPGYGQCGLAYGQIEDDRIGIGAAAFGVGFAAAAETGGSDDEIAGDRLADANLAAAEDLDELAAEDAGADAGSGGKAIVIGEDMQGRVIPTAERLGADYYDPPEAPPSEWMENNRQWINDRMDEGCTIYDCGPAPGRANYPNPTSEYYQMELNEIAKRGYPTIPIEP